MSINFRLNKSFCVCSLIFFAFGVTNECFAEEITWASVLNVPKGENFPAGVLGDIRGLTLGENYDTTKLLLDKIRAESDGTDDEKTITESSMEIMLPVSYGSPIQARYPQQIKLDMAPFSTTRTTDLIITYFSAPSSSSQLVGIYRSLNYNDTAAQPKISEVLKGIESKFGGKIPVAFDYGSSVLYQVNFDAGSAWSEEGTNPSCATWMVGDVNMDERAIADINPTGRCDIVLNIEFRRGISADHAETIIFRLSDNERGQKDFTADFKYYMDFIATRIQQGGAAPKL